eukprot:scaffold513535_cov29-Prasinocladus_malaysianus.AAC.1
MPSWYDGRCRGGAIIRPAPRAKNHLASPGGSRSSCLSPADALSDQGKRGPCRCRAACWTACRSPSLSVI